MIGASRKISDVAKVKEEELRLASRQNDPAFQLGFFISRKS